MSFTTLGENKLLKLLFNNDDWTDIGDASGIQGSAAPGSFLVSLHTATPGEGGDQDTNEASYTGYARVAKARSSAQWAVASGGDDIQVVSNNTALTFAVASSSGQVITHAGIGAATSGAGYLYMIASLTSPYTVTSGNPPEFAIGALEFRAE
jgi:hypothetical protein